MPRGPIPVSSPVASSSKPSSTSNSNKQQQQQQQQRQQQQQQQQQAPRLDNPQSKTQRNSKNGNAPAAQKLRVNPATASRNRGRKDGVQQPPPKSSLDLAWSYSRSQAQHKGLGSSPSFTERHWAGPQHGQESEDGGETDDFESEFGADEESSQAISSDDGEDAQSMEGLDHEGSRTLETTPTQHRYSSRQVQRLTQDAREERYRSRSRSPKRLALSSGMALRDSGEWVDGDGTIGGRGRARGREGVEGDDDGSAQEYRDYRGALSGMEQGATSRARVGSHHERYSLRSSSRDFSDDEGDDDRGDSSNRRPRVHRRSSSSSSAGLDHRNGRLDMGTPLPSFANERTALLERRHGISSARSEGGKTKVKEAQNGVHHPTTHSTKDDDGEDDRVSLPAGKSALLSRVWSVTFGCCLRRRR